ncbi:MAG TPA: hypothetical protein VIV57_06515 [Anaeromyxobacter sp.]
MRIAVAALAVLAVAFSREGCGSVDQALDACAGKACGDDCSPCGQDRCGESPARTVCDGGGRCVVWSPDLACSLPDPCAGKACGNTCVIEAPCRLESPPCMLPDFAGQCDARGLCVPGGGFTCPMADSCMDRGCGVPCSSAMDMMPAMACDGAGSCISPDMLACTPLPDPCAGKACGDACDLCGGMCMFPAATVCDRNGACVFGALGTCPP